MATVQPLALSGSVMPRMARWVEVRELWSDTWQPVPWLRPLSIRDPLPPGSGQATLSRDFGTILQNGSTAWVSWAPVDVTEWYVRVRAQRAGNPAVTLFTGIVLDAQAVIDRASELAGEQTLTAASLDVLLDRSQINTAKCKESGSEFTIGRLPAFNRKATMRSVLGNRTNAAATDGTHRFSRDGSKWTARDILEYLFGHHVPEDGPDWELCGQLDAISPRVEVWDFHGKTLREIVSKLVDRRRGLAWRVQVDEVANVVQVWIFTLADMPITAGAQTLPANSQPMTLTLPSVSPFHHLLGPLEFRQTQVAAYDVVEARCTRPLLVTATFSFLDGTLETGWNTNLEYSYINVSGSPSDRDVYRASDRNEGVFCRFVVPKSWDGKTGGNYTTIAGSSAFARTAGSRQVARPAPKPDGGFDLQTVRPWWNFGQKFLADTCLEKNADYTTHPLDRDDQPEDVEIEYLAPLVLVFDSHDGPQHKHSGKYYPVERLHEIDPNYRSVGVKILDKQMGFELRVTPRHYFAHPDCADIVTNIEPEWYYQDLQITATFATDDYPFVERQISDPQETERRLTIDVPGAEYWFCPENTVVGVSSDLLSVEKMRAGNRWLRRDQELLEAAVGFAFAWFAVPRQAIKIPIADIGWFAPLGAMLQGVTNSALGLWMPVRTVISSRTIDFQQHSTVLETSWGSLDFWG